jgi:molybdate transport system permease protein
VSAVACLAVAFLLLPLVGLLARAPWRALPELLVTYQTLEVLRLSLLYATAATVLSLLLGVPLAWTLAHARPRTASVLRALVTLPLVLPPVVGGLALLLALGRTGVVGRYLESWFGITLPFTGAGVVVAETFVAMPFLVLSVEGALRSRDRGSRRRRPPWDRGPSARSGASPCLSSRPVSSPAGVLSWARALGEFGATITFAGNLPGRTQTLPLAVYLALETDPDAAITLSLVLLVVSLFVLVALRDRWLNPGNRAERRVR